MTNLGLKEHVLDGLLSSVVAGLLKERTKVLQRIVQRRKY